MKHDPLPASRLLGTLGICKKAGKLAEGFDPVADSVRNGAACLVLTACDLSPKSEKEILRCAAQHNVECIKINAVMDDIWARLGRRSGILAISDPGLAQTVKRAAAQMAVEEFPPATVNEEE